MGDPVTMSLLLVGGAISAGAQGMAQKQQYEAQAESMELQNKATELNVANEELQRRRTLDRTMASQNALFAASGQTAGFGSAGAIQKDSLNQSMIELQNSITNRNIQTGINNVNIANANSAASSALPLAMVGYGGNVVTSYGISKL